MTALECGGVPVLVLFGQSSYLFHVLVRYIKVLFDWHPRSGSST